jgi:hypothetical protein
MEGTGLGPIGTHACISLDVYFSASIEILNFLWERNEAICSIMFVINSDSHKLFKKPRCHMVSETISISKNTAYPFSR